MQSSLKFRRVLQMTFTVLCVDILIKRVISYEANCLMNTLI